MPTGLGVGFMGAPLKAGPLSSQVWFSFVFPFGRRYANQ